MIGFFRRIAQDEAHKIAARYRDSQYRLLDIFEKQVIELTKRVGDLEKQKTKKKA